MKRYLVYGLLISLTILFFLILSERFKFSNDKVKKIKGIKVKQNNNGGRREKVFGLLTPLLEAYFSNTEKRKYKFIRSGGVFQRWGVNEDNFLSFEVLFTSFIFAIMVLSQNSMEDILLYTVGSVGIIEYLLHIKIRKRHGYILDHLPVAISNTIEYLQQGYDLREVFIQLPNNLNEGPLKDELLRLRSRLGIIQMSSSIEVELKELSNRIGMEEVDNYILALIQHEISGRVNVMLEKQLELLKAAGNLKVKRETAARERLSSLATVLLVVATLLIIIVPLLIIVLQNELFH